MNILDFAKQQLFNLDILKSKLGIPALIASVDALSGQIAAVQAAQTSTKATSNEEKGQQEEVQMTSGTSPSDDDGEVFRPQIGRLQPTTFEVPDMIITPNFKNPLEDQVFDP